MENNLLLLQIQDIDNDRLTMIYVFTMSLTGTSQNIYM